MIIETNYTGTPHGPELFDSFKGVRKRKQERPAPPPGLPRDTSATKTRLGLSIKKNFGLQAKPPQTSGGPPPRLSKRQARRQQKQFIPPDAPKKQFGLFGRRKKKSQPPAPQRSPVQLRPDSPGGSPQNTPENESGMQAEQSALNSNSGPGLKQPSPPVASPSGPAQTSGPASGDKQGTEGGANNSEEKPEGKETHAKAAEGDKNKTEQSGKGLYVLLAVGTGVLLLTFFVVHSVSKKAEQDFPPMNQGAR
jgi:hypothetical protein